MTGIHFLLLKEPFWVKLGYTMFPYFIAFGMYSPSKGEGKDNNNLANGTLHILYYFSFFLFSDEFEVMFGSFSP